MKFVLISIGLLMLSGCFSYLHACPKGSTEWEGGCAATPAPEESALAPAIGVVSDEKAPRHPEPAYQRGEVKVDMPVSLISRDADLDREKAEADAEGKKAAGVK